MTDLPYWTLHEAPPDSPKKWAVRVPTSSGRGKVVLFGARGYEDFTTHHDVERRERYRTRHQRDRLDDPYAPGFWSMWALWGESDDLDTAFTAAVRKAKKLLENEKVPYKARKNPVREQFNFSHYEEYASQLTDDQLHHAIIDALNALKVARTWEDNGAGEAKYLDQLSVLRREQKARGVRSNPEWARKVGGAMYRGTRRAAKYAKEVGTDLYHGAREAHSAHRDNPSSLTAKPVLFDPYTGDIERQNPIPQRAEVARSKPSAAAGLMQSGIGTIEWEDVEHYIADWKKHEEKGTPEKSALSKFVRHFRLLGAAEIAQGKPEKASDLEDAFIASNAKTSKDRVETSRKGEILGLALFPHFYPNVLAAIPEQFLDENGVVDTPMLKKDQPGFEQLSELGSEARDYFNGFEGATRELASEFTGVPTSKLLDFCVGSSEACRSTCLVLSGNNPASTPAVAKKANLTQALLTNPPLFVAGLFLAIDDFAQRRAKRKIDTVIRFNMLSDLPWYSICPKFLEQLADPARGTARVYLYDYTKLPFWRSKDYQSLGARIGLTPGQVLDLTFSFSGDPSNTRLCKAALDLRDPALGYPDGIRVAAAFAPADPERKASFDSRTTFPEIVEAGKADGSVTESPEGLLYITLPELGTRELVDGDGSDYRIDDPGGCIVSLNFKQPSVSEESVPGIGQRMRASRETFTQKVSGGKEWYSDHYRALSALEKAEKNYEKKAEGPKGVEALQKLQEARAHLAAVESQRPRSNPKRGLPVISTGDAPEAVEQGALRYSMFRVGGLLVGPHVPTLLED